MALVVETGTGRDPTASSYASRTFATAFHAAGVNADAWDLIDPPDQERALVSATRLLDATMSWRGRPLHGDQPLGWPRRGVVGPDYRAFPLDKVPDAVRLAAAVLALRLAQDQVALLDAQAAGTGAAAGSTEQQVQEITLGPIGIKMATATAATIQAQAEATAAATRLVPAEVAAMLRHWGDYVGSGSGASLGPILR
jgi:hypothetical protein